MNKITFFTAIMAFTGVCLGAFGAHSLQDILIRHGSVSTWDTAVFYHLVHAVAAWATGLCSKLTNKVIFYAIACWLGGIVLFSGSLYLLALDGPRWLGPITPLGGLLFLVGWALAAKATWSRPTDLHSS